MLIESPDIQTSNLLLVPSPPVSTWGLETVLGFVRARKPINDQRPSQVQRSDTKSMKTFFDQAKIAFDGSVKLADFGSGFVAGDARHGDLGVRGDVESPERMEDMDWSTPADIWSLGCTVLELFTGRQLFKMSEQLQKKWSDELGLQMLRDTLGQDSTRDDAVRPVLKEFLSAECERKDVTNFEIGVIEEIAAGCIQWKPEARLAIAEIHRIWQNVREL